MDNMLKVIIGVVMIGVGWGWQCGVWLVKLATSQYE